MAEFRNNEKFKNQNFTLQVGQGSGSHLNFTENYYNQFNNSNNGLNQNTFIGVGKRQREESEKGILNL